MSNPDPLPEQTPAPTSPEDGPQPEVEPGDLANDDEFV